MVFSRIHTRSAVWLCFALLLVVPRLIADAYPLVAVVDEGQERCFRFNVPANDEAHLVVLVLPSEDEIPHEALETWYVEQLHKMAKSKPQHEHLLPLQLPEEPPAEVAQRKSAYLEDRKTEEVALSLRITGNPADDDPIYKYEHNNLKYFQPLVINRVSKVVGAGDDESGDVKGEGNLQGYGVCLHNKESELPLHIIFEVVLKSDDLSQYDEVVTDSKKQTTDFDKDRHLTPLERTIDLSIRAANSILREMKFMEKREARMRVTADSINSRVRWFGYLSVAVLLVVTYLQVTYLKQYFHKKKLM